MAKDVNPKIENEVSENGNPRSGESETEKQVSEQNQTFVMKFQKFMSAHANIWQIVKFTLISLIAFLAEFASMYALQYGLLDVWGDVEFKWFLFHYAPGKEAAYGLAGFVAFLGSKCIAEIISFAVNRKKTFNANNNVALSAVMYVITVIAIIILSTWLGGALGTVLGPVAGADIGNTISKLLGSLLSWVIMFLMDKFVIMRKTYKRDVMTIGHSSLDRNIDADGSEVVEVGGAVLYSSAAAYSLGHSVLALTKIKAGEEYRLDSFAVPRANIKVLPAEEATSIENRYLTADKEKRLCKGISQGDAFVKADIPSEAVKVYHFAGLIYGDYEDGLIDFLAAKDKVAVDVQGFLRHRNPETGEMYFEDWADKMKLLPKIHYLKTDAAEAEILTGLTDRYEAAKLLHKWGAKEVMITHNTEVIVYDGKKIYACPIRARNLSGRSGRGDTTFAAYIAERQRRSVEESLIWATAAVSMKMEKRGALRAQRRDILNYIKEIYPEYVDKIHTTEAVMINVFQKAYYRIYQAVFRVVMPMLRLRKPELIKGEGSILKLPSIIKEKGIDSVLVVTDNGLYSLGMLNGMFEEMDKAGVKYTLFKDVVPNPTVDNVENAYKAYVEGGCKAIVAFGGGSPMDCAKGVGARVARPSKPVKKMKGILKVMHSMPPFFAVPTTSGTGSEATLAAVIMDSATHDKYTVNDPSLIPHYAVLDPALTVGLPKHITSTTGMDALTHAVEAYIGQSNTALTVEMAEKATDLIFKYLKRAYDDGKDMEARENMQEAAYCAGVAFTRAYVGYVHAIAHSLGGKYGVPHGLANAVILPYVLDYYGESIYEPLSRLADIAGVQGKDVEEKALNFIAAIREMNDYMNVPKTIKAKDGSDLIKEEDIPAMVEHSLKEANPLYPVPKFMGKDEMTRMYYVIQGK